MLGKLLGKGKTDDKDDKKKGAKKKAAPEDAGASDAPAPPTDAAASPDPPPADASAPAATAPAPETKAALRGRADASPLAETAAAIEAARKAAGEEGKVSVAFGTGETEAAVEEAAPKRKKKKGAAEDDEAPLEDELALPKKKKLPLQIIFQTMAATFHLILLGVVSTLVLMSDPPPKRPGHLVEFDMPEPGRGFVGMQGAPGVLPPPEPEYGSLEPVSPDLMEESPHGYVPKIAEDGREPWRHYAGRYRNPDKRPRIAVVFMNMGLTRVAAEATIGKMPAAIAFAFQPYARETERYMDTARAQGHEAFIQIPLEPSDHPNSDPGPHALLTKLAGPDNVYRLEWALSRSPGFVGVTYEMGDKFLASAESLHPVFEALKARGLMVLDMRLGANSVAQSVAREIGLPIAVNDVWIDRNPAKSAIDQALAELERIALKDGYAIGAAEPNPNSIERVLAWTKALKDKGIVLAPVSALAWKAAGS
jgi:polysaccharide deacetylase 2 family uncharacterized protein YibQ